jgi:hypothetical protein
MTVKMEGYANALHHCRRGQGWAEESKQSEGKMGMQVQHKKSVEDIRSTALRGGQVGTYNVQPPIS